MSRRTLPLTTLTAGDRVTVNLRGQTIDLVSQWAGEVVAVDHTAVRLKTHWFRVGLSPCPSQGTVSFPGRRCRTFV